VGRHKRHPIEERERGVAEIGRAIDQRFGERRALKKLKAEAAWSSSNT